MDKKKNIRLDQLKKESVNKMVNVIEGKGNEVPRTRSYSASGYFGNPPAFTPSTEKEGYETR